MFQEPAAPDIPPWSRARFSTPRESCFAVPQPCLSPRATNSHEDHCHSRNRYGIAFHVGVWRSTIFASYHIADLAHHIEIVRSTNGMFECRRMIFGPTPLYYLGSERSVVSRIENIVECFPPIGEHRSNRTHPSPAVTISSFSMLIARIGSANSEAIADVGSPSAEVHSNPGTV